LRTIVPAVIFGFMGEVTRILSAIDQGDPHAAEQLLPVVYEELRKLAAQKLAQEKPGQTLQATALVHEPYLRLVDADHLLDLPAGTDIVTFMEFDGRVSEKLSEGSSQEISSSDFRDAFVKVFGAGAIEDNTMYTSKIHFKHLAATLGDGFQMNSLMLPDLQRHLDRRQKDVAGVTIKKEIDTIRSAWRWAQRMGKVQGDFPNGGLDYPRRMKNCRS